MKVAKSITLPVRILNRAFASNLNIINNIMDAYEGHIINVTFKKRINKRSNSQNAYYWSVIAPIFQNCIQEEWNELMSIQEVHNLLKSNCNYEELVNEETGEIIRRVKSTTENTTVEQEVFHEKCRRLALEYFNTTIPLPDQELKIKF